MIQDIEQIEHLAEQTNAIVKALNIINEDGNNLDELVEQTGCIAHSLGAINNDENDLEELERTTGVIAASLQEIQAFDLDALEAQLDRITTKLETMKANAEISSSTRAINEITIRG